MGDGTEQNPYTRDDVLRLIEENGGTAEELDLSGKTFEAGINLSGRDLRGIILTNAIFPVHFERGKLVGANLQGTNLEGVRLWHAQLERAYLFDAHLEEANLRGSYLEEANLQSANLEGADLTGARLEGALLTDVRLSSDTKLHNVDWGNYILAEERHGPLDWAEDTYRQLKQWYTNAGISDIAAKFYYREKEANRKSLKWCSWSSFRHRFTSEIIRGTFGYGERWWNVLYWIAALILLFTFTYLAIFATWEWWQIIPSWVIGLIVLFACINSAMSLTWVSWKRFPVWLTGLILLFCAGYFIGGSVSDARLFGNALYFSAVSFTALGYGECVQMTNNWIKGIGAFESLVGVFMMALLLVTFVRKWTR